MKASFFSIFFLFTVFTSFSQKTTISGFVKDAEGSPLIDASVFVVGTQNVAYTDVDGAYQLQVTSKSQILACKSLGYLQQEIAIDKNKNTYNFSLKRDPSFSFDDILIVGKSSVKQIEESGFNAIAIDAKPFHNATVSMTEVLERAPGVKIQEAGGLGSRTNVTINGLSGRHVRFFIDGMPMDAMSSAFQVNNLPINLAERIEVYKGVVPVKFGSDALGGAVNIVTKKTKGTYLDASYSYGSFNTHRTFVNAGYTSKSGFTAQLNAFQNYSDNDYYVDATIKDFETNLLSQETQRVRRFHDVYHNEVVIAKLGLVNKSFADQLLFGFTLGHEYDEIQHPAYLNLAFGEKYQTSNTIMPSLLYAKKDLGLDGLDFSIAANYNFGGGNNYDLSDREYNWLGEWVISKSLGESSYSDFEYKDRNGTINANLDYEINSKNRLTINNVSNFFSRKGDEKKAVDDYINEKPRVNNRNILGVGLNTEFSPKFNTSIFGKMYSYHASAYLNLSQLNGIENFETVTKDDSKYGYGFTATYFLKDNLQLKANYENTVRLPVSEELFGAVFGFYLANFDLKPEISNNYNFGVNYNWNINEDNVFSTDVNFFYRRTSDYIRLNISYSQGEGSYENTELVKTPGVDLEMRYSYKNRFVAGVSASYLEPKNYTEGSTYYKSTLPNQPTLFGQFNASYFVDNVWLNQSKLSFNYVLEYVDAFLYDYDAYQAANRAEVPKQISHNISTTYSWKKGKYNLSLDAKNILDETLYDNFSLQKPGRSFSVKFRYFFNKL
ncbi:Outer membrane receptor proteins, mostly Fe transport [Mesonia phycicola]|uniref:Outer membrane receptor proteins, mostly Fe transport n=1 Tax=Mesonia phycicola TaxID=579105 RepID=A0A1M6AS54_9FLAO|nr:TonB-dependent receptor [Mesonia phycicola]SHI39344.1 Outer membrane receptor proteins, mostly Fe transport [Mesonia phycicola]